MKKNIMNVHYYLNYQYLSQLEPKQLEESNVIYNIV
jgi:hypothetical protein